MKSDNFRDFKILDKEPGAALCEIKGDIVLFGGFAGYHQYIIERNLPWPHIMIHGKTSTHQDHIMNPFEFFFLCALFKGENFDLTNMRVKKKLALVGTLNELDRSMNLIKLTFQGPDRDFLKSVDISPQWRNQYLKERRYFSLKNIKERQIPLKQLISGKEFGEAFSNKWSVERIDNMVFLIKDHETGSCQKLDITPQDTEIIEPVWKVPPYYGGFPAALAFSLQILGYGSPFQSKGPTTCMMLRLNGLPVLVDCCPFWDILAREIGVSVAEIDSLILTHCHEDHMGGIAKLLHRGKKIRIYTAADIFKMALHILSWQMDTSIEEISQYIEYHPIEIEKWMTIYGTEFFFQYTSHPIPCISVKARKRVQRGLPCEIQITSDTVGDSCASTMLSQGVISQQRYDHLLKIFEGEVIIADAGEAIPHPTVRDFMGHDIRATFLGHRQEEMPDAPLNISFVEPYHLFPFENLSVASIISQAIDSFLKPLPAIDGIRCAQILRESSIYKQIAKGQLIVQKEMEEAEYLYIVGFGIFSVIVNNQEVAILHSGNFFGEQVFVSDKSRNADVKAVTYGSVILLPANVVIEFLENNQPVKTRFYNLSEARELLSRSIIFSKLDIVEKTHFALSLEKIRLDAREYLIRKGEQDNCGYLLSHGALNIPGTDIVFTPPAIVGEFTAAGFVEYRTADIQATEDFTSVYKITPDDLQSLMRSNPDIDMKLKNLVRSRGLKV